MQGRAVLLAVTMPISRGSQLLLVCLVLTCHFCEALRKPPAISFTPEMITSYATDLDFMLMAERDISEDRAAKPRAPRQISEDSSPPSNSSSLFDVCSYDNFLLFLSQLNATCQYALASLDTDNVTYLASQQAMKDIDVFCTDDCAGNLLEYYANCPQFFISLEDYVRGVCSKNSGFRCGLSLAVDDGSVVYERCFLQTSANDRCRFRCKNALRDFSNQIGCCINTYYNDTYRTVGILQSVQGLDMTSSPWLWDTCGIPYPSECPPNVLSPEPTVTTAVDVASPTPAPSLCGDTEESSLRTFLSEQCTSLLSEFVKPAGPLTISNSLSSISELCDMSCAGKYLEQCGSDEVSESLGLFCGRNDDLYCGQVLADSYRDIIPHFSCGNSHNCSSDCSTELQSVSSMLGCCVHAFALADPSVTGLPGILDDSLWSSCGLELPSQCPHPFLSAVEDDGTTGAWMAAVFIPLIVILLALVSVTVVFLIFLKRRTNKGKMRPHTRSSGSDLDINESYSRPTPVNAQVRGQTERGFEYTTTASIARHFRMDTSQHRGAMEVSGERITALANGELHAERNIYQSPTNNNQPEKIEVKKNEAYNVASSNSSPILAAANRPVSELEYHYVRTDPIVTIKCGDHQGRSDGDIVTELNISYAGNSEVVSPDILTASVASCSSSKEKPAVMPRKKRAGPISGARHDSGSQDHSNEGRTELNASNPLTCSPCESSASAQSEETVPGRSSKQTHFKNPTYLQRANEN